jgi:predicted P-loop ATPase
VNAAIDAWEAFDPTACDRCGSDSCEGHGPDEDTGDIPQTETLDVPGGDFEVDRNGRIVAGSLHNLRLALARLGLRPAFNAFTHDVELGGAPLDDVRVDRLWVQIADTFGFQAAKAALRTVILADAHHAPWHPVRQYLDALHWDETPRLDGWLTSYGGADDTPYVRAVGALPLVAAVRRVRQAGCKFDELLVLESAQGTLKSSALRALCPVDAWFSDDLPLGVDSKQVIERTAGKWIIEAAELHGNRGREAEALKAFLSRQIDGPVRLAYGRLPVSVPRQFVLIGTTNARLAYLKDGTGARRFWPVRVRQFDVEALTRDRDQLWAEAAAREAAGMSIRLDPALWADAALAQEDRRAADPWEPILEPLLVGDGLVAVEHVVVGAVWAALKLEANHLDNRHADRVAAIVQRHGFTGKRKIRVGGKSVWCWVRDTEAGHV